MSKIIQTVDDTYEFTQVLVEETLNLIYGKFPEAKKGRFASTLFLAKFSGALIYNTLKEKPIKEFKTKDEYMKFTMKNFQEVKEKVQEVIAAAFTGAMNTYAGKNMVEYYCTIKPIPAAANKEPI